MTLTTLSTLAGLAAAISLAAFLGGAEGTGVLTGYLAGAAVTGACFVRQRRILRERPDRALRSMIEGFLVKLGAVVAVVLAFVVFPALREVADLKTFFLAFAGSMLLLLFTGTFENAQSLRGRRAE